MQVTRTHDLRPPSMRLDAASTFARTPLVRRSAIGGSDPATETAPADVAPAIPPPSLDGKGTLINTYA